MPEVTESFLREQLQERRQKLQDAVAVFKDRAPLLKLLQEVDSALDSMDSGSYGLCQVCHEPVEKERLMADPLVKNCLDHMSQEEQRALEQDLDLAWRIQSELLPKKNLRIGNLGVYYHYEALGPVSGDYCDVITTETGELFFLLGDVSGKGVAASILMSHLHAIFRSLMSVGLAFDQLMERANRIFCESTTAASYATLVCGRLAQSGVLEICNAGHCPPIWVGSDRVARVESTGLPLGMFCGSPYGVKKAQLNPGDSLLLYTDGLTEAFDRSSREYGPSRLEKLAGQCHKLTPQAMVHACLDDLAAFLSGAPKSDDLAIMAIQNCGS